MREEDQSTGFAHHLKLKRNNATNKLGGPLSYMQTWE
jgi:hypothetical protein